MQKDKQFRVVDNWALASDGLQWVLRRQKGSQWEALSFVSSSKSILARCMREKGTPLEIAEQLLEGLPDDFEGWHERFWPPRASTVTEIEKTLMPLGTSND